jgi:MoxR-like ATPase
MRTVDLQKAPGVSETLDWTAALVALDREEPDAAVLELTLGVVLKDKDDLDAVRGERLVSLLARANAAHPRVG